MTEELRVEKEYHAHMPLKPNITKGEAKALKDLKQGKDKVIPTVEKEVTLVVLDRQECIREGWTFWRIGIPTDL